ncbi:MAG: hypothetical protein ACLS4Z_06315 [Christensenellaceae bacterium]
MLSPEIIHIGGDEVEHIGGDKYCRAEAERLGRTGVLLSYFVKYAIICKAGG